MRQILLGVIIVSILTSCSERENLTFDKELQNLGDPSQIFTITNDKADTIETRKGIRIIIPPNTFVLNDGQGAKESIQIELREVFDKSDMILNGLGTLSDGRLLESFGMVFLRATSDDRELKIKENSSITVSIPNRKGGISGELFYGTQSDRTLNWKYAGAKNDTIKVIETTIMQLSDELASVKKTTYRHVNGLKEFVSDTLFTTKYECCQDSVMEQAADDIARPYEFKVTKLGWINCDRFIDVPDKVDLDIELKTFSQPIAYLVFSEINSIMEVLFDSKGKATASNLPKNYQADLVILDKIKGDFMWTKQNIKIGVESKLTSETRKLTVDELKGELKKLDK